MQYNDSYRVSANVLHFLSYKHDKDIVRKVNELLRKGTYAESFWQYEIGLNLDELQQQWKSTLAKNSGT